MEEERRNEYEAGPKKKGMSAGAKACLLYTSKMTDCEQTVDVSFTACHFLPFSQNIYKETVGAYYERKEQRPSAAFSVFINILFECLHLRRRLCDCDIDETEVCG